MAFSPDNTPPGTPTADAVPDAGFWCQEYVSVSFHSSIISPPNLWNDGFTYDNSDEDLENGYHFPACHPNNPQIGNESNEDYDYDSDSDSDHDHDLFENEEDDSRKDPASRSLIESIPSVKITEAFIGSITSTLDPPPSCSVCTEEFVLELRQSGCLVTTSTTRMALIPAVDGRRRVRRRIAVVVPFRNFGEEVEYEMEF